MNGPEVSIEFGKLVKVVLYRISDNGQIGIPLMIEMKWWDTITTVRSILSQRTGVPPKQISVIYEGKKLPKVVALYQLNVSHNEIKLLYHIHSVTESDQSWIRILSTKELDDVRKQSSC